ncbi:MAG: LLM class flavin-dependent oxidoreductase [Nostocoides sp.]
MTDYGQPIEFGLFPSPKAEDLQRTLDLAQRAEVAGLDLVSIQDHPYQGRFVDTWTLLSVIGARKSAIRLSPNVANLPLRPPVVLAKSAATLDLVTGGRVELGLGTGGFWDAIVAAGGPRRSPGEAVEALVEAIEIIRAVWAGDTVRVAGSHYSVEGLHGGPVPAHPIPIWLGAYKPRMLRVTGRLADGWVPSMGYAEPPALAAMSAQIDQAALAAGRSPAAVKRVYNIFGAFGTGSGFLQGTPANWVEDLSGLALDEGMSTFILGTDDRAMLERFAAEVAPAVRDQVEAERGRRQAFDPRSGPVTRGAPDLGSKVGRARRVAGPAAHVAVTPTHDDGSRLSDERLWNEATRPSALAADGGAALPADDRQGAATAQHLIDVHDGLRAELAQVRSLVEQVRDGHLSVGAARSVINTMTMRQNSWTLGAYCESYCRIVTGHHSLEDRSIFPHLRRADRALVPVIDRLEEEHLIIADVLERVDRALVAVVDHNGYGPDGSKALESLQSAVDALTDTLLSHLAYEERELIGPLARHGFA